MPGQLSSYLSLVSRIWRAPGNRGRRLGRVLRSMLWLVNKKTLRRAWTLAVYDGLGLGLRLRCHPGSIIALHVVQRSEWHDWDTAKFITGFLRPGDVFMDVGTNIGLYTLPAARLVGESGAVIAVEPSSVNRARLEENLVLNEISSVQVMACALGETAGEMAFCDEDALAHLEPPDRSDSSASVSGVKVPIRTLDSIAPADSREIALLKVDVEGFELSVFRGALQAMGEGRLPVILFEVNDSHLRYGVSSGDILGFLRAAGYEIGRYENDRRCVVSDDLQGDILAYTPRGLQMMRERLSVG